MTYENTAKAAVYERVPFGVRRLSDLRMTAATSDRIISPATRPVT
jgi:hypothetical protein